MLVLFVYHTLERLFGMFNFMIFIAMHFLEVLEGARGPTIDNDFGELNLWICVLLAETFSGELVCTPIKTQCFVQLCHILFWVSHALGYPSLHMV